MKKESRFFATTINCYTENHVLIVGIGNHPISPDRYLIISRFDDGEIDDAIGIQTNNSTMEVANAISNLFLQKNSLTVEIKADKQHLVGEQRLTAEFTDQNIALLTEYIKKFFLDSSVNLSIDV